jgi:hypothetical protein
MNMLLSRLVISPFLIASCAAAVAAADADGDKKETNDFTGKIVCVQMTNDRVVLENAKIIVQGKETFLSGTGIKRNDPNVRHAWWEGLPIRLNVRFVQSYFLLTPQQWNTVRNTFVIPGPTEP